ncbi:hypothetical protein [Desulfovibrio sp. JC010]|nr:hypothetical protein [Desulfovibrio sp. JC010]
MTGEGVEAIIVMLVVILAIFKMVKRNGNGLGSYGRYNSDTDKKRMEDNE